MKKIYILLAIVCLMITMVACSNNDNDETVAIDNEVTIAPAANDISATPVPTEKPAKKKKEKLHDFDSLLPQMPDFNIDMEYDIIDDEYGNSYGIRVTGVTREVFETYTDVCELGNYPIRDYKIDSGDAGGVYQGFTEDEQYKINLSFSEPDSRMDIWIKYRGDK